MLIAFAAANYNPDKYPNPTAFELERGSAQQLGMGVGTHFCLGAWLARSIMVITLHELLTRVDHIEIERGGIVVSSGVSNAYALEHVPAKVVR